MATQTPLQPEHGATSYGATERGRVSSADDVDPELGRALLDKAPHCDPNAGTEASNGHGDGHGHHHHWWGEYGMCRRPTLLVEWVDGEGVRKEEAEERHITWSELFADLIYVSAIARLGEDLRGDGDTTALPIRDYIAIFFSVWAAWYSITIYATRWFTDDLFSKGWMAMLMIGITLVCTRVRGGLVGPNMEFFGLTLFVMRLILIVPYCSIWCYIKEYRKSTAMEITHLALEGVAFLAAALVGPGDNGDARAAFLFIGSASRPIYLVYISTMRTLGCTALMPPKTPPLDLEHWCERYGLFLIIVLGESINGISVDVNDFPAVFYVALIFGFFVVFNTKLLYFDVDQKTLADHALRRSIISATFWACAHYLLFVCTAITGSGVAMACAVAGDAGDFPEPERRRWFMASGQGVVLISLSVIRLTHVLPGADLPDALRSRVQGLAVFADALQIVMGAVCCVLPAIADEAQLGDVGLLGLLAGFTGVNVCVNIVVRVVLQRAERQWDLELEAAAEHGDKQAAACKRNRDALVDAYTHRRGSDVSRPRATSRASLEAAERAVRGGGPSGNAIHEREANARQRHGGSRSNTSADAESGAHASPSHEVRSNSHVVATDRLHVVRP